MHFVLGFIFSTFREFLNSQDSYIMIKFGIIKEGKTPPDRRVVFSPSVLAKFKKKFPEAEFAVESSDVRIFSDDEYREKDFVVTDDLSDCDVLLGVKEVPISQLIPNTKYFFFSHTIKQQPYNRDLLCAILNKNIELYDHEVLVEKNGNRLVGFGRYAGIVGAYNGFRAYGLKHHLFTLPKAETLKDQDELIFELRQIVLPNIKIVLTGSGKVAFGAKEMLDGMGIKQVDVNAFLQEQFEVPVYARIDVLDYNVRKDGKKTDRAHFYANASEYNSDFAKFAEVAHFFIAGHFYAEGSPFILTREMLVSPKNKISVVADISCDIDGPVACTIRPSTIANPIYGYNPSTHSEVSYLDKDSIAVMAVDNLPCELPRDASNGFGEIFLESVIPAFFNGDEDGVLQRAQMTTSDGSLTPSFQYLTDYVNECL